ncbi:MAG: hypothetical protein ACQET5_13195 [Halobacteriota archaeon]
MKSQPGAWLRTVTGHSDPEYDSGILNFIRGAHNGLFFTLTSRFPLGTNVFSLEWDVLIILDACRVDALRAVAPEYAFLDEIGSIWSVGSSSHEWMCKTFTKEYLEEIEETLYISTNPNTPATFRDGERPPRKYPVPIMAAEWNVVDEDNFGRIIQIHRHPYKEYFETIDPETVTDYAIHACRQTNFNRKIIHYFQPHRPYIGAAYPEKRPVSPIEDQPWDSIRSGDTTKSEIWELYLDNLRLALDSIEQLLENVDAKKVAITADHGELFGELSQYGHPEGVVHPKLKRVPWAVTSGTDKRKSEPEVDIAVQDKSKIEVEDQLKHLGYI